MMSIQATVHSGFLSAASQAVAPLEFRAATNLCACDDASMPAQAASGSSCSDGFTLCSGALPPSGASGAGCGAFGSRALHEWRALNELRTILDYHQDWLSKKLPPRQWVAHIGYLRRLTQIGAYDCIYGHRSSELMHLRWAAESIERLMRYRPPAFPPTALDRDIALLFSDAAEKAVSLERSLLDAGAHNPSILVMVGEILLSCARRVDYFSFLMQLTRGRGADAFEFNMAMLRGMEAARRFHVVDNGWLYGSAIDFLNRINELFEKDEINPQGILTEQYRQLKVFLEHIAETSKEAPSRAVAEIRFVDIVERSFAGLYAFTPALFSKLAEDANALGLPDISILLGNRAVGNRRTAARLGLPT